MMCSAPFRGGQEHNFLVWTLDDGREPVASPQQLATVFGLASEHTLPSHTSPQPEINIYYAPVVPSARLCPATTGPIAAHIPESGTDLPVGASVSRTQSSSTGQFILLPFPALTRSPAPALRIRIRWSILTSLRKQGDRIGGRRVLRIPTGSLFALALGPLLDPLFAAHGGRGNSCIT